MLAALKMATPLPVRQAFQSRPFQIFIIVAAIIGLVYWFGIKYGRQSSLQDSPLPNNGSGIPAGWKPDNLVLEGFDVLDGVDWTGPKEAWLLKLLVLTDDQLTAVYNKFNKAYGKKGNTMTKWILDDTFDYLNSNKKEVLSRLGKIGLD